MDLPPPPPPLSIGRTKFRGNIKILCPLNFVRPIERGGGGGGKSIIKSYRCLV